MATIISVAYVSTVLQIKTAQKIKDDRKANGWQIGDVQLAANFSPQLKSQQTAQLFNALAWSLNSKGVARNFLNSRARTIRSCVRIDFFSLYSNTWGEQQTVR